jgi:hypothetical protein
MLPPEAKTYFDILLSGSSAQESIRLAERQKTFERGESSRGVSLSGAAFAARLASLYSESLLAHAKAIVEALKTVHRSFNSPLDDGVDTQLVDWGAQALSQAFHGLEGAYSRHLRSLQIDPSLASGLEHRYALAQATVHNQPMRYLWELRNVPAMRPHPPSAPAQTSMVINIDNKGTMGALQLGADSTANVQQQWVNGDTSALQQALAVLRAALEQTQGVDPAARRDLVADVDSAVTELEQEHPNKGKLLRWLGGVGAVVGTIADVQPAYEAVKKLAQMLGIPL